MIEAVKTWAAEPFSEDMDVWKWVVFLVFALTIAVLWLQILNHIIEE